MELPPHPASGLIVGPLIPIDVNIMHSSQRSSASLTAASCSLGHLFHCSVVCNSHTHSFSARFSFKHVKGWVTAASLPAPLRLCVRPFDRVELAQANFPLALSLEEEGGAVSVTARVTLT